MAVGLSTHSLGKFVALLHTVMEVITIGFTRKLAHKFFELVRGSGAKRVADVRLNNVSQLAGLAKREDLAYFLDTICGMEYVHLPGLAGSSRSTSRNTGVTSASVIFGRTTEPTVTIASPSSRSVR